MCRNNNITPYYTAVYFQRQNPVERKIQDFKNAMKAIMLRKPEHNLTWDLFVHTALRAQRTRQNRATGETPAAALLGYELTLPGQWEIPEFHKQQRSQRTERTERRQQVVARQLDFNQKTFPDRHRDPEVTFEVNDLVMYRNPSNDPFSPPWLGPYPVTRVLANNMYEVEYEGRQAVYHIDQLRRAPTGNPPLSDDNEDSDNDDNLPDNQPPPHPPIPSTSSHAMAVSATRPAENSVDQGPLTSGQPLSRSKPIGLAGKTTTQGYRERAEMEHVPPWKQRPPPSYTLLDTPSTAPAVQSFPKDHHHHLFRKGSARRQPRDQPPRCQPRTLSARSGIRESRRS